MSKTLWFARQWTLPLVLSLLCVTCCLPTARAQNNGDPLNPTLSASFNNVPFRAAMNLLSQVTGIKFQIPPGLAAQIDPATTCTLDIKDGTFQDALNNLLDQIDPPLDFHVENGAYVLEMSKTPRPNKAVKKPIVIRNRFGVKDMPFEKAVEELFSGHNMDAYRIDPTVSAYLDPVTCSVEDATFEQRVAALLTAVPGQKTPLICRKEKDIYIIAPQDKTLLPNLNNTPIGLPSYHPSPVIKSVAITNEHPNTALLQMFKTALLQMFKQAGVNYHFAQPSSVADTPRLTFATQGVPLEQAVVHLLRSAPTRPLLHLNVAGDPEAKNPGSKPVIYDVGPSLAAFLPLMVKDGSAPVYHHWFGFRDCSLYEAVKTILTSTHGNYTLDGGLNQIKITASGSDLPLEQTIRRLLEASPKPVRLIIKDDTYHFELPTD